MKKIHISATVFGILAAFIAVGMQVFGSFSPPQAYGVCVVCHAKDLVNALLSQFPWFGSPVSTVALKGTIMTVVGIFLGGLTMSIYNRELKLRFVENKILAFVCGFVVMCAGLALSGCPMRTLLRTAYGDISSMASVISLILGIFLATLILKRRARRQ
ncbi:MAG: hypothetical protein IJP33_02080 [Firmicutes bacterium]|nr:hypothetical protein [Bacillota bacterium]